MIKTITTALLALTLTGCATMLNERTQPVKLELVDDMGGTKCTAQNDEGRYLFSAGSSRVNRDNSDLVVTCENDNQTAQVAIESKQEGSWYLKTFIAFFPCVLACPFDYLTGNAAYYPSPAKVMMDYKQQTTARNEQ